MTSPTLQAGDTYTELVTVAAYPASAGWVLKARFAPRAGGDAIELVATADGDSYRLAASAANTAGWSAGAYSWVHWVERAAEVHTVGNGQLTITPNLRTGNPGDTRSQAERALAQARDAYAAWKPTKRKYKIGEREMEFNSVTEILRTISYWEQQVAMEKGRYRGPGRPLLLPRVMSVPSHPSRPQQRETGSVILREFREAMEARRSGILMPHMPVARSFQAAEASPFTAGLPGWDASINAILLNARPTLVTRSRHWARNTGPGRRFHDMVRDNGVGPTGYTLAMRCGDWRQEKGRWVFRLDKLANDAIERAWLAWGARGECEATGRLSFADVCRLQLDTCARDGEYMARHLRNPGDTRFRYRLQLLQTDRLDHHHNHTPAYDGAEVRMGVHRNSMGRATAYTLLRGCPERRHGPARRRRSAGRPGAARLRHAGR